MSEIPYEDGIRHGKFMERKRILKIIDEMKNTYGPLANVVLDDLKKKIEK
jgi:hypothetical protein